MYYLGISIILWLLVGFIVAVKNVLIWDEFTTWDEDDKKELLGEFNQSEIEKITSKKYMFVILTLCGFISLYADFKDSFSKS